MMSLYTHPDPVATVSTDYEEEGGMTDAEKLAALAKAYAELCDMFCKDPMKNDAYRQAVEVLQK